MHLDKKNKTAWESIKAGWENKQLAHAYLLQGSPTGAALEFAKRMLNLIFDNHPQVQTRTHPDLIWIEPQSKSRQIRINEVRDIITRLSQTAFSGGWKVGVLSNADRMTPECANAFLKTLEEPPPKTLLILITDQTQSLLPTITSRCQKIIISDNDQVASHHWEEPLLDILSSFPPKSLSEAGLIATQLTGIIKELYKLFENEEQEKIPEDLPTKEAKALLEARASAKTIEARTEILRAIQIWQRDVLMLILGQEEHLHFLEEKEALLSQAKLCDRAKALKRIADVDAIELQLNRNLPVELVFNNFVSQFV